MSGSGGGKPGVRQFWDTDKEQMFVDNGTGFQTYDSVLDHLNSQIEALKKRIEQLETAYMEDKMLGSDPGKIET